jgi:hypothetical protein
LSWQINQHENFKPSVAGMMAKIAMSRPIYREYELLWPMSVANKPRRRAAAADDTRQMLLT